MTFTVYGSPAPQGSKRAFVMKGTGRAVLVESSKAVKPWREAVVQAVMLQSPPGARTDPILFRGPVALDVTFTLARPKSAKKGARPAGRPDIDKLVRSTLDALTTSGVFEDDGCVVSLIAEKVYQLKQYAPGSFDPPDLSGEVMPVPGAVIRVEMAR